MDSSKIAKELISVAKSLVSNKYPIHHSSFSSAVDAARTLAEKSGFEIDEDDWFNSVSTGPRKPSAGKTNRYKILLTKNGKPVKKMLVFQVYGMDKRIGEHSGTYELNAYIS
jgi:hypothetical protein